MEYLPGSVQARLFRLVCCCWHPAWRVPETGSCIVSSAGVLRVPNRFQWSVLLPVVLASVCLSLGQEPNRPPPPRSATNSSPRTPGTGQLDPPALREAQKGEVWITQPTVSGAIPAPAKTYNAPLQITDSTPPSAPGNLTASSVGLFLIQASWSPSADAESGVSQYVYAIGTGTDSATEANRVGWQALGNTTRVKVNLLLTSGQVYYLSVRSINGANLYSPVVRSGPLTATPFTYGQGSNQITYAISPTGFDSSGAVSASWSASRASEISSFLDKMLPVLYDLYGPPSTTYTVTVIRDLRYTSSAVFFPSTDEIHMGDSATYQLITHEMVHAFRRDRILSAGSLWQFDTTLSPFEEGFAQAVSYDAMTEFARRYPTFGLTQFVYQSSNEWDYDFQNVPELRTTDLWSDAGGTLLYWVRYEMAAAAIAKISREYPAFYKLFNAEFYRRINANPVLTPSRSLVKEIIQTVAPVLEGRSASAWVDQQNIFDCAIHTGKKVWIFGQHYPWTEYIIFNRTYFYETFANGSDWAVPNGAGGYTYYSLNGSTGQAILRDGVGSILWQKSLLISPVNNPPVYYGFGSDEVNMTTQFAVVPGTFPCWDVTSACDQYATNLLSLDLYQLGVHFDGGGGFAGNNYYRVMGSPLRNTSGVFGGIIGAEGGRIYVSHRGHPGSASVALTNKAFWFKPNWSSVSHPSTVSVDSDPGIVDVTYVDAAGSVYTDTRAIGYGSSAGTQAFLFDVTKMRSASGTDLLMQKRHTGDFLTNSTGTYTLTVQNTGTAASIDPITVSDVLPAGLTFLSASGNGWNCGASGAMVTCVSQASVAGGGSAPVITLQVGVGSSTGTVVNQAAVSSLSDANPVNNVASDETLIVSPSAPSAPTSLTVAACFKSVSIMWADTAANEDAFILERKTGSSGTYQTIQTLSANSVRYVDEGLAPGTYYYRVRSSNASGGSSYSNEAHVDAATGSFTDDPVTSSVPVRSVHITELRSAVNATRACAGLAASTWTDASLQGAFIKAVHFQELRNQLAPALAALGLPTRVYADDPLVAGITIRKAHLEELRQAVK